MGRREAEKSAYIRICGVITATFLRFVQDRDRNAVKSMEELRTTAKTALVPIDKKLMGFYTANKEHDRQERETTTSNLVQGLIQDATDLSNLVSRLNILPSIPSLTAIRRHACIQAGLLGTRRSIVILYHLVTCQ